MLSIDIKIMDALNRSVETSNQMRVEIQSVVKRYCLEGDLTYYQILGVLETVKDDVKEHIEDNCKP